MIVYVCILSVCMYIECMFSLLTYTTLVYTCVQLVFIITAHLNMSYLFLTIRMQIYTFIYYTLIYSDMLHYVHTYFSTIGKLYIQGYNFQPNQPTYKSGSIVKNTLATYYGVYTPTKTWAHDHMITTNYLLFFESSIQFDPEQFLAGKIFSYNNKHIFKIGVNLKTSNSSEDIG